MSLKSSETNNCSWRISTVLVSFLVSSSCHVFLPLAIRPMRATQEIFLEIFFFSPELNCSIIFSMHMLSMTKKMNQCLRYFPGSMSIQFLLPIGTILGEEPASSLLCGFALDFDRHAQSFASNLNAYSSSWTSGISCSMLFKFVTNLFKPGEILTQEWVLSLFTDEILISTPYLPCKQQVATSTTGTILVFPWIHPFGCDASSSLGRVYSRQATAWNCENSSVSFVLKYCPFLQHSQIMHPYKICSICLVVKTFQFVLHIAAVEDLC